MGTIDLVLVISRMVLGAVCTFLAIILWSHTRDTAWMLVIVGVIVKYGEIVLSAFGIFGLVPERIIIIPGVLTIETLLALVPLCFFAAAFLVMILRNRFR